MANPLEVIVNDVSLDLFEDSASQFYGTLQIHDLTNLQTRNASFLSELEIPATQTNIAAFNGSVPAFITSPKALKLQECVILVDGVTIILNAKCTIPTRSIERGLDVLNVTFELGNLELFTSLIGDISLIDWSDLDFEWTSANLATRTNNTTGLVFAFSNWFESQNILDNSPLFPIWRGSVGAEDYGQEIDLTGFHIYLKEIVKRIVEQVGFTLDDTEMLNEPDYNTLALACPMDAFYELAANVDRAAAIVDNTGQQLETSPNNATLTFRVAWDNIVLDGAPEIVFNDVLDQFEINDTISGTISFNISGNFSQQSGRTLTFRIVVNTTTIGADVITTGGLFNSRLTVPFTLSPGDIVFIEADLERQQNVTLNVGNTFSVLEGGDPIDRNIVIRDYIPQINKKAFLQSFLAYFNAVIRSNNVTRVVTLTPIKDFTEKLEQDLSDRIDTNRAIETLHTFPNLFRISDLKYADDDNLRREDANSTIIFDDELLDDRGTIIQFIWGASDIQRYILDEAYSNTIEYPTLTIDTENISDIALSYSTGSPTFEFSNDVNYQRGDFLVFNEGGTVYLRRIDQFVSAQECKVSVNFPLTGSTNEWQLIRPSNEGLTPFRISNIGGSIDYQIYNGAAEQFTSITGGLRADFTTSMLWANLKTEFYEELFDSLGTPYVVRAWVTLEPVEVLNLDFTRPVYVQLFNSRFYINKLEQYKPLTKEGRIELLRVR